MSYQNNVIEPYLSLQFHPFLVVLDFPDTIFWIKMKE
jgi:hypothetical protein